MVLKKRMVLYGFLCVPVMLLAVIWAVVAATLGILSVGGPLCNNWKAAQLEKELSGMPMPTQTRLVEVESYVGNTSGTGDHTEIWVGMLLQSSQSKERLSRHFEGFSVRELPTDLQETPRLRDYMDFASLDGSGKDRYFIVERITSAFTQLDLRGM